MIHRATFVVLVLSCGVLALAEAPATRPASGSADFVITPMRIQELKGADGYLYGEAQTSLADIKQTIDKLLMPLTDAAKAGKIQMAGPVIMVYEGMMMGPAQPFTIQVGVPVAAGTQAFGDYKVRELKPLRAATVIFSGALANISMAYQQAYSSLFPAGLRPGGENREIYLHWEGPDSPNNIVVIQVGVQ